MNNTTISYYDLETGTVTPDLFSQVNHRGLGDTGSDLQQYGAKLYCVVNVSETIEIMDAATCESVKQLSFPGKQPRKIAFHQGFAYVCCFSGDVLKIDTATMTVADVKQAGRSPESLCVVNNKLYVANSGGMDFPNYDKTITVFNLPAFSVATTIEVGLNPTILQSDGIGALYVISRGNYDDIPATFKKIDCQTDAIVQTYPFTLSNMAIAAPLAYIYNYDFGSGSSSIQVMNLTTGTIVKNAFITDNTTIAQPYHISVSPFSETIYITESYQNTTTGDVYGFSPNGVRKFKFEAGINPCKIVEFQRTSTVLAKN
jgi:hypothetical protein